MAILSFLVQLAGATMLLLFAVRMVRTGIERSYGASFQRILTSHNSLVYSGAAGVVLAGVLQSSAAVALLVAGFASSGLIAFASGLALVLGGDLGSALVIQVLTFRLEWLVPLLLAVGGLPQEGGQEGGQENKATKSSCATHDVLPLNPRIVPGLLSGN